MRGYICDTCGWWIEKLSRTDPHCHHPRVTIEEHFADEEILAAKIKANPGLDWLNEDELCICVHEHWRHLNIPEGEPEGRPDGACAVCMGTPNVCDSFQAASKWSA